MPDGPGQEIAKSPPSVDRAPRGINHTSLPRRLLLSAAVALGSSAGLSSSEPPPPTPPVPIVVPPPVELGELRILPQDEVSNIHPAPNLPELTQCPPEDIDRLSSIHVNSSETRTPPDDVIRVFRPLRGPDIQEGTTPTVGSFELIPDGDVSLNPAYNTPDLQAEGVALMRDLRDLTIDTIGSINEGLPNDLRTNTVVIKQADVLCDGIGHINDGYWDPTGTITVTLDNTGVVDRQEVRRTLNHEEGHNIFDAAAHQQSGTAREDDIKGIHQSFAGLTAAYRELAAQSNGWLKDHLDTLYAIAGQGLSPDDVQFINNRLGQLCIGVPTIGGNSEDRTFGIIQEGQYTGDRGGHPYNEDEAFASTFAIMRMLPESFLATLRGLPPHKRQIIAQLAQEVFNVTKTAYGDSTDDILTALFGNAVVNEVRSAATSTDSNTVIAIDSNSYCYNSGVGGGLENILGRQPIENSHPQRLSPQWRSLFTDAYINAYGINLHDNQGTTTNSKLINEAFAALEWSDLTHRYSITSPTAWLNPIRFREDIRSGRQLSQDEILAAITHPALNNNLDQNTLVEFVSNQVLSPEQFAILLTRLDSALGNSQDIEDLAARFQSQGRLHGNDENTFYAQLRTIIGTHENLYIDEAREIYLQLIPQGTNEQAETESPPPPHVTHQRSRQPNQVNSVQAGGNNYSNPQGTTPRNQIGRR